MPTLPSTGGDSHPLQVLAGAVALGVLGWAGYAAVAWFRYGRAGRSAAEAASPLLDRLIPDAEVAERHERRVDAPADITFAAARELDLNRSPLVRAIFAARTLPPRRRGEREVRWPGGLLAETLRIGWGILAEVPEREIAVGAVTRPWEPVVRFRSLPPAEFAAFAEPGFAKIVWTLAAEPLGADASLARTETRVRTTDPGSRERFRRYWAVFSPGILLIRLEALRLVKREAERRHAARRGTGGPPG